MIKQYTFLLTLSLLLFACTEKSSTYQATEDFTTQHVDDFEDVQLQKGDLCQIDTKPKMGKIYEYYHLQCTNGISGYITHEHFQHFKLIAD